MTEYQPTDDELRTFADRLEQVIVGGLAELKDKEGMRTAVAVADLIDNGKWRLRTRLDHTDGEPDLDSLWYIVEVLFMGGWQQLVEAPWTAFGISAEGARSEAWLTLLQNGLGTVDVPDDLSSLTDPPPDGGTS